ncbi:MAG: hypothetical protein IT366_10635 [Candidatus Hydrogenedentes bacterium]|nr:hypothetical protein [Candidatus Hydrogenedentota bacterium]
MVHRRTVALLLVASLSLALTGCPPGTFPPPPYDTTGTYVGTWRGKSNEDDPQRIKDCPLQIELTQNIGANFPEDHFVTGTVTIDYSCMELPEWIDTPPPSVVEVAGALQDNGTLTLISGGCTTALCVVLTLGGTGVDQDDDGTLDAYAGAWAYTILLAGVEPFGFTGKFAVALETETP